MSSSSEIIAKSKDTFRFVKTGRIDPEKKDLAVRQVEFVEIYNPVQTGRCGNAG